MGMDGIEIVMDIEDAFGITIPDDDASNMVTVGQTFDYVLRQLESRLPRTDGGCQSQRAFYRLRQDLVARYGPPRRSVRPDSRIGALVPVGPARRTWPQFARGVGLPVPGGWCFSTRFPDPETTLRELVPFLVRPPFSTGGGRVDEQAVWLQIVKIVSEQAGIDQGEIQPQTRYIDDLHLD